MKRDAESHAEDDRKKREYVEVKNAAESTFYTAEKALRDAGDKVPAEVKSDVESKMSALKSVKDAGDISAIRSAADALISSLQKIGEAMYRHSSSSGPEQKQDSGVKEAEFEEKKEDKENKEDR